MQDGYYHGNLRYRCRSLPEPMRDVPTVTRKAARDSEEVTA